MDALLYKILLVSQGYLIGQHILGFSVKLIGVTVNDFQIVSLCFFSLQTGQETASRRLQKFGAAIVPGLIAVNSPQQFSG
jgi:hypothetical protein